MHQVEAFTAAGIMRGALNGLPEFGAHSEAPLPFNIDRATWHPLIGGPVERRGPVRLEVDEVLVLSGHPMGVPVATLPALALDYAREVPTYGDHFGGPRPGGARLTCAGQPITPAVGIGPLDRVQTSADLRTPEGAAVVLGALAAGASLVLVADGAAGVDLSAERVTLVLP